MFPIFPNFERAFAARVAAFIVTIPDEERMPSETELMENTIRLAKLTSSEKEAFLFGQKVPAPKIGAILVQGRRLYCSARSGVEVGDHAEYSAIETGAKDQDLKGSVLFTTLEPCTAVSRHEWTKSCSVLIADRKIAKVFVGTLDQNPLVTGFGIDYLLDHDVDVAFYPRSFGPELQNLNHQFFDFFSSKADYKAIKDIDKEIGDRLDWSVISSFYRIRDRLDKPAPTDSDLRFRFYRDMIEKGEITEQKGFRRTQVSDSLVLAFFLDPSLLIPGFRVSFYREASPAKKQKWSLSGDEGIHENRTLLKKSLLRMCLPDFWDQDNLFYRLFDLLGFDGLDQPDAFLKGGKALFAVPQAVKEMIVNAVVHNDYRSGVGVSIRLHNGYVELDNAASLSENADLPLLNKGTMMTIPSNPRLMDIFEETRLVEHSGYGMQSVLPNNIRLAQLKDDEANPDGLTYHVNEIRKVKILSTNIALL